MAELLDIYIFQLFVASGTLQTIMTFDKDGILQVFFFLQQPGPQHL